MKKIFIKGKIRLWFSELNENRYFIIFVNRLRASHYKLIYYTNTLYNLNESLFKKELLDNSKCSCGYEKEDINYVVFECSKYDSYRTILSLNE